MKRSAFLLSIWLGILMMNLLPAGTAGAQPASPQAAVKIMPLGDSITQSVVGQASYRYWLDKKLHAANISFDFVGSMVDNVGGPPTPSDFDLNHEGHSGYTTWNILEPGNNPQGFNLAASFNLRIPDIVLLHMGTVDVLDKIPTNDTIANLGGIIDKARAANPNVAVLIAQIIPKDAALYPADVAGTISLNQAILPFAHQKNTAQARVIVVDQFTGFNATQGVDTYDGVHPNASGEQKVAARFFQGIFTLLAPHRIFVPGVVK
jgi:hypothetical protein